MRRASSIAISSRKTSCWKATRRSWRTSGSRAPSLPRVRTGSPRPGSRSARLLHEPGAGRRQPRAGRTERPVRARLRGVRDARRPAAVRGGHRPAVAGAPRDGMRTGGGASRRTPSSRPATRTSGRRRRHEPRRAGATVLCAITVARDELTRLATARSLAEPVSADWWRRWPGWAGRPSGSGCWRRGWNRTRGRGEG